jgi:hypothetical protein
VWRKLEKSLSFAEVEDHGGHIKRIRGGRAENPWRKKPSWKSSDSVKALIQQHKQSVEMNLNVRPPNPDKKVDYVL